MKKFKDTLSNSQIDSLNDFCEPGDELDLDELLETLCVEDRQPLTGEQLQKNKSIWDKISD